jgi:hypothetical protein
VVVWSVFTLGVAHCTSSAICGSHEFVGLLRAIVQNAVQARKVDLTKVLGRLLESIQEPDREVLSVLMFRLSTSRGWERGLE